MALARRRWVSELLAVWYHRLSRSDWFNSSDRVDRLLRERFAREWDALRHRSASEFLTDPQTALAAILLFDQVPRNIHRNTADAFATDGLARTICHGIIARGWLAGFSKDERQFALMPLMHSERLSDQELSRTLFARHARGTLSFARSHWRMIARFGRFPHRNQVLGRSSTPAERHAVEAGFSW